jgi:RNA polymerase sigma-32 factor
MTSNALIVRKPLALTPRFDLPVPVGNLDAYIAAINRVPLLSAEEEVRLAREYRDSGNLEAASRLVMSHLRLVVSIARQYMGYGLAHADLIQEGNIGLMKAVKRFDPERGVRLVSFAMHWVKAEIHEYIVRNWRLVKIATTKAQRKLFFNLRSMKTGSNSLTSDQVDVMARELDVRPEDVIEMETRLGGGDVALEGRSDDNDEEFAPIAWLASEGEEPTEVLAARSRDRLASDGLAQALDTLDERSRTIVQSRWLAEPGEDLTLHQLAAQYGVSAERIRQIETAALKKMKAALGEFRPGMAA